MKGQARNLISQNRLVEAIQQISSFPLSSKLKKSLALTESRLNAVNEKIRLGVLSEENANIELNKIRNGLLNICDRIEATEDLSPESKLKSNLTKAVIAMGFGLMVFAAYFFMSPSEKICEDRKIAILVADFKNTEKNTDEAFSNTLTIRMDNLLDSEIYDVTPVGRQSRNKKKYHDFIRAEYFESSCDTSGLFVNGFLSEDEKIFNIYMTIANLKMNSPEFAEESSIDLDNPSGIDFSIKDNANFLADFIFGIIKSYEGKSYEALDKFFDLEKDASNEGISMDNNFKASMAHFKANCYAMRGDNKRANLQYGIVKKYGGPELKKVADNNLKKANEINKRMKADPELRLTLKKNISEHSNLELELERFLNKIGKGIVNIFKKIK